MIKSYNQAVNLKQKKKGSHHVTMFRVGVVLQQLLYHLNVALLGCGDQRRPAVLRAQPNHHSRKCLKIAHTQRITCPAPEKRSL